jgi:hypothetical protein
LLNVGCAFDAIVHVNSEYEMVVLCHVVLLSVGKPAVRYNSEACKRLPGRCLFIPFYALRRPCKNLVADISRIFLSVIKPMEIVSILEQPASGPEINPWI